MLSDELRFTPRQKRVLDAIESGNGQLVAAPAILGAMYPAPRHQPGDARGVLKVTVCQLRKMIKATQPVRQIETVWRRGYRLI